MLAEAAGNVIVQHCVLNQPSQQLRRLFVWTMLALLALAASRPTTFATCKMQIGVLCLQDFGGVAHRWWQPQPSCLAAQTIMVRVVQLALQAMGFAMLKASSGVRSGRVTNGVAHKITPNGHVRA